METHTLHLLSCDASAQDFFQHAIVETHMRAKIYVHMSFGCSNMECDGCNDGKLGNIIRIVLESKSEKEFFFRFPMYSRFQLFHSLIPYTKTMTSGAIISPENCSLFSLKIAPSHCLLGFNK